MKVLFFVRALTIGGSERQLALTASGLARRGHDVGIVVLYTGGALESMARENGVRLLPLGKMGRWHMVAPLVRFWRVLESERPDILYAYLPTQTTLAALVLPPWLPTRLVFGIRAGGMELTRYDRLAALSYRLEALLSPRADLAIANARAVRADAVRRGLAANRIAVIANGIDTNALAPDPLAGHALRQAWGIDDRAFVVGIVARLDPMKDHGNFLDAAAIFARENADARFVCIGDGPLRYRNELMARASSLGLSERLVWTGEMRDVKGAYNASHIVTLSSAFGEGFPNVVGEAMACGTPVAATDVGDTRYVIGNTGEVVPPQQAELLSAAWTQLRKRLREDGPTVRREARSRIVNQFGIEVMVGRTEAALTALSAGQEAAGIAREFA